MKPTPNILPINNTTHGRGPVVDAILRRRFLDDWLKRHKSKVAEIRQGIDDDMKFAMRAMKQIAAGRKVKL